MLMIRQSLDADSDYADIALHGVGLTSLQAREAKGAATHEVQSYLSGPKRARLVKRGPYFYMYLAEQEGGELHMAGGAMRVPMEGAFYVGIGVCAHNKDAVEKAVFSNVELAANRPGKPEPYSTLETITVSSTDARVTLVSPERLEAPNWTHDGKSLLFNSAGKISRVVVDGGPPEPVDTGFAAHCTRFHGLSPDGLLLAFSDESRDRGRSAVYVMPLAGGIPERVTALVPSSWQAWSPDGKSVLLYGERRMSKGLYTIPVTGGAETFLTKGTGGEYSPDGKYIYFTSNRSGSMQIWRMGPDGKEPEPVTNDEFSNWRPHLSPDGRQLAFVSLEKSAAALTKDRDITIRMMTLATKTVKVLAKVVGGEGTLDAPSWSPDSRRLAFVSYQSVGR
jgi:Tol biopolymer transport system component